MENKKIKILIGYHKPAVLLKDEILTPIHLGRSLTTQASKDGKLSKEDFDWMLENMIGDDTGNNISHLNRYFCELTGIYWAWKNYDKLGNPDYIGFMHYRRLFAFDVIFNECVDDHNLLHVNNFTNKFIDSFKSSLHNFISKLNLNICVYSQNKRKEDTPNDYRKRFDKVIFNDYVQANKILEKKYPSFFKIAKEFNSGSLFTWSQMFILNKQDFFSYCEWLFNILFELHKNIDYRNYNIHQTRSVAYCGEFLNGIYAKYLKYDLNREIYSYPLLFSKNTDLDYVLPVVSESNNISVVFSVDSNYINFLSTALFSISKNSKSNDYYDICILYANLEKNIIDKFLASHRFDNIKIRFFNINNIIEYFLDKYKVQLKSIGHFTIAMYYRFLIPFIFKKYNKVLYLDCDLIARNDISVLYNIDIQDNYIGAIKDMVVENIKLQNKSKHSIYLNTILKIKNEKYFNSGVLLFNIEKCNKNNFTDKCFKSLLLLKDNLYCPDQDILNYVCKDKVYYISFRWNFMWNIDYVVKNYKEVYLDRNIVYDFILSKQNPYIIHYCDYFKPWSHPHIPYADIWWHYARQ
ncbi:hypothetical protein BGS46_00015, partial [Campylobacter sp. 113]